MIDFPAGELTCESKVLQDSLMNSGWEALTLFIMENKCFFIPEHLQLFKKNQRKYSSL